MANKLTKLEFEIRSTDSDRKTIDAVRETISLSEELQSTVAKEYPGAKVEITRKEGLPIHALVHHIIVSIDWHSVASGAEKAIAQFATSEFLTLAKDRIRNVFARPIAASKKKTKPAKKSAPTKKAAAAKKTLSTAKPARKKAATKSKGNSRH